MPAIADLAAFVPVPVLVILILVRYGPRAVVTIIAGLVAALSRSSPRGQRALNVLALLHGSRRKRDEGRG